jgi:hypothetical protein
VTTLNGRGALTLTSAQADLLRTQLQIVIAGVRSSNDSAEANVRYQGFLERQLGAIVRKLDALVEEDDDEVGPGDPPETAANPGDHQNDFR